MQSRAVRILALVWLAVGLVACPPAAPPHFSPLIEPGASGRYDLVAAGTPVTGAELAPGARPARSEIAGKHARKQGDFLVSYAFQVRPADIGRRMLDELRGAPFLSIAGVEEAGEEAGGFRARVTYRTPSGSGALDFSLAPTAVATQLRLRYEVEETLR